MYWDSVISKYKEITIGVKNLIKWTPVIWADRDWDYHYFLKIMESKLTNMHKEFSTTDIYVGQEDDTKKMLEALTALREVIEEGYLLGAESWEEEVNLKQKYWDNYINILRSEIFKWWS